ncbi:hypothetical protein niasHS_000192 [Heterodera schachtii]|uniref:Secreted protein n=1 Tax=Heterodera schachtii TaxID=97005 RepID=A0ABD2KCK8_HETSC
MSLITSISLAVLVFVVATVRESEAGCCCCHCCKCCSCCTPCCNPPLLIKLPRTCPCCCKCCCPCCCCCGGGGGGRKRRDVRLLWKRAVPFPQLKMPSSSSPASPLDCQCKNNGSATDARPATTKRGIVMLNGFMASPSNDNNKSN